MRFLKAINWTQSLLFILLSYAGFTQTNQIAHLQKFVAATVQIPFRARVANVQSNVAVRVTFEDSTHFSTQIEKPLRDDCDKEALRVVKLINVRNLRAVLGNKNTGIVEVPFYTETPLFYQNGKAVEYFDKEKRLVTSSAKAKYIRQYAIDTLTGAIKSDVEWLEIKKKGNEKLKVEAFVTDSTQRYRPRFLENPADTMRIVETYVAESKPALPVVALFENGTLRKKMFYDKMYLYYPNGRISNTYEFINDPTNPKMIDTHWFYNGQIAFVRHRTQNEPERYVSVWDSTGQQIVLNGNGLDEYYEGSGQMIVKISGMMKNGLKEGLFRGKNKNGQVLFEGYYSKNNLIKGLSYERWVKREAPL